MRYKVTFRERGKPKTCRVNINPNSVVEDYGHGDSMIASEYSGGNHNYDGTKGAAVERCVRKIYGRNAFWFGEYEQLDRGQVFRALRPTKRNSNPGNSAVTPTILIDVKKVK